MPKALTNEQIKSYSDDGFLFPFDVYSRPEADDLKQKFEDLEAAIGDEPQERFRIKAQLPFPWLCDVVRNPILLDAVEDLIGPDILCWGASFFAKKAHDPRYVSWHTDSFFYGFDPAETLTAWLAFNPSTEQSGCVQYIPGSHKSQTIHEIKPDADNILPMAQNAIDVPLDLAVSAVLEPGQVVFHHEGVVHGSSPNNADHPRVGLSIHYVAPHVRETRFEGSTAMLLRGKDELGHWGRDPEPTEDFDMTCIKAMHDTRDLYLKATAGKIEAGGRS
ncbi:MAG: phytanoyl-CoA dioxygenase family protein [Rhodospirillales bacterium]|nr:phytanoyl-CoA dioxygenase family protein [Rhodospirillales bacterium]